MTLYRHKQIVIEAAKLVSVDGTEATFDAGEGDASWLQDALMKQVGETGGIWALHDGLRIGTLEGTLNVNPGDYIVRGTKGELYPVKSDIFRDIYEPL